MSKLLIEENPLQVLPKLASAIGLNEAIMLQQVHYWMKHAQKDHDGRKWFYKSYTKWQEQDFPFWSTRTIQRVAKSLQEQGYLLIESLGENPFDRRNHYSINMQKVFDLEASVYKNVGANDDDNLSTSDDDNLSTSDDDNLSTSLRDKKEIKKDTVDSSKKTKKEKSLNISFEEFWDLYDYKSTNKKTAEAKWSRLTNKERELVIGHLPSYVKSTPNKTYRKHPTTYLNQEHWNTPIELEPSSTDNNSNRTYHQSQPPQPKQQASSDTNGEDLRAKFLENF